MVVGICMDLSSTGMREKFERAASLGFGSCQLVSWDPPLWNDGAASNIRQYAQEAGITITAFWCGWEGPKQWNFRDGPETLGLVPEPYRFQRMKNLMDGADFAKRLGVTDVISHMGFIPEAPASPGYAGLVSALRSVAYHLKRNGQNLLFETGQETPVTMLRCFEDIGTDNVYVNLDPANLVMYGKGNPVDALDVFGRYVRGVHAKDGMYPVNGRDLGCEVKVGTGKVDFPLLLKGLRELKYDGSLTIEREIEGEQQTVDIMDTKKYLEKIIERL